MRKTGEMLAAAMVIMLLAVGCQRGDERKENIGGSTPTEAVATPEPSDAPEITPTAVPTEAAVPTAIPTEAVTPTPTAPTMPAGADTGLPSPTPFLWTTPMPTPTPIPDVGIVYPDAVMPDLTTRFTTVTGIPADAVQDIKGKYSAETFPRIDGSTATIPISEAIYMYATGEDSEAAAAAIKHTKTSKSYYGLFNGDSDLLIVYEPSDAVIDMFDEHPVIMKPIGLDALVFMTNTDNPVESVTMGQLQRIYTGEISSWERVGGPEKHIYAFQRPEGTGSQNLIKKVLMGELEMCDPDNGIYDGMEDILEGLLTYNGQNSALGYSVFYYANNMYYIPELRFMAIDGVMPSVETIYSGEYKLVNPFYAVIRADEPEDSAAHIFFDWLTGDAAQQIILDLGYVPVNMPENAVFPEVDKNYVKNPVEVFDPEPMNPGEYFVYYYKIGDTGNAIVYNNEWETIMTFYSVFIPEECRGRIDFDRIVVTQQRTEDYGYGAYLVDYYGIFDLKEGAYVREPDRTELELLGVNPMILRRITGYSSFEYTVIDSDYNVLMTPEYSMQAEDHTPDYTTETCMDDYSRHVLDYSDHIFRMQNGYAEVYYEIYRKPYSDDDEDKMLSEWGRKYTRYDYGEGIIWWQIPTHVTVYDRSFNPVEYLDAESFFEKYEDSFIRYVNSDRYQYFYMAGRVLIYDPNYIIIAEDAYTPAPCTEWQYGDYVQKREGDYECVYDAEGRMILRVLNGALHDD